MVLRLFVTEHLMWISRSYFLFDESYFLFCDVLFCIARTLTWHIKYFIAAIFYFVIKIPFKIHFSFHPVHVYEHTQMAALLIDSGADIDAVDGEGNSSLMLCVVCEHVVRTYVRHAWKLCKCISTMQDFNFWTCSFTFLFSSQWFLQLFIRSRGLCSFFTTRLSALNMSILCVT